MCASRHAQTIRLRLPPPPLRLRRHSDPKPVADAAKAKKQSWPAGLRFRGVFESPQRVDSTQSPLLSGKRAEPLAHGYTFWADYLVRTAAVLDTVCLTCYQLINEFRRVYIEGARRKTVVGTNRIRQSVRREMPCVMPAEAKWPPN
jgi:hypothetical protein